MTKTVLKLSENDTIPSQLTMLDETIPKNDTRRQKIPWYSRWTYRHASDFNTRAKIMDNALQTIYMARHKIRQMEKEKHFNRKDTGYRIAFLYKYIRKLYRRLVDIYMTSLKRIKTTYKDAASSHDFMAAMHQRAVRIHTDFLYYYWVMIEIDKRYRDYMGHKTSKSPDLEKIRSTTDPFLNYNGNEEWKVWQ
ncbi:uncharacterized protein LOC132902223 [Amyelois transitella]|uniref:uncharacterized protein LOC132902223 n=1 Tax=Amyelois transitella TaxID=680683 RepID=UPI00298FE96C|nr:uncharacterized protein LOC132902223 [Amyelois transitella]